MWSRGCCFKAARFVFASTQGLNCQNSPQKNGHSLWGASCPRFSAKICLELALPLIRLWSIGPFPTRWSTVPATFLTWHSNKIDSSTAIEQCIISQTASSNGVANSFHIFLERMLHLESSVEGKKDAIGRWQKYRNRTYGRHRHGPTSGPKIPDNSWRRLVSHWMVKWISVRLTFCYWIIFFLRVDWEDSVLQVSAWPLKNRSSTSSIGDHQ